MGHGYPRPQLTRDSWTSLDGEWDFAFDPDARWQRPADVRWDRSIVVPFAPETRASGIGDTGFFEAVWYRRRLPPVQPSGRRVILHFGAVDWDASVWVDGLLVVRHQGGYTPFWADITELV